MFLGPIIDIVTVQGLETEVYHVIRIHRICTRLANLF